MNGHSIPWFASSREWLAFKIAPWAYVPHRECREEAFKRLSEIAYGSRDAIWTSPTVLVSVALGTARAQGRLDSANSHSETRP